ncbi:flagellar hook-associated protein FlgL [Campylobacter upsaliensis]|uniref:flagellar hook-associated protein FlgL n=1 Tax=Campylobacter upsaliensis TaxID=28080 RepID=UPI001271FCCE|nr:flagellar hook-associated protein FlgL [Campylobacter upsaliensis]EAH8538413.1 flagellar hook-associated protein FlgL [Campylobacter upsaliensis]EAI5397449.1 flagellar hook-associated protein FlgL [Campylobacter upsaliensis]EAI7128706.1 flagellar hook-associated protein FlgL [Campylobacter upsaliensis]EAI8232088.1 flagellar hook-associated protein FlgL [Campylobacter upsaliensis]EAI8515369.1 flagellar hook-associated protein FlgL [Campylobacter upsaliensis]
MRVTNKLNFTNSIQNTMSGASALNKLSMQLSSGMKIQDSYEDASIYIDNTRLEYELKTLEQIKEATSSAKEMTSNSMKALQDMVKLLENFKVKVTQAASDSNSQTSREAIAKELEKIKEQIVQLANTSINGQYLFAGAQLNHKPFDSKGNYFGDKNNVNVVTGAGTESPYNIPGFDLFFKADGDYQKQITTNESFTDNRHDLSKDPSKKQYLKGDNLWQDLIGLGYVKDKNLEIDKDFDQKDTRLDFPPTTLYVQGVKPDGQSFKSAVLVNPTDKMEDVLEKIGNLYGNTATEKVVDVTINDSGQIQIRDLKEGNNKLDFHAVAYTPQFDDKTEMEKIKNAMAANNPAMDMDDLTNLVMTEALKRNPPAAGNNPITDLQSPVQVTINNQQFTIDLHQTDFINSKMTDTQGNATNGADYDNTFFEKHGNSVIGNVSQVIQGTNAYATDDTKLSEVMSGNAMDSTLNLTVNSKGGNTYNVTVNLQNSTVSFPDPANPGQTITFPITHTNPTTGNNGVVTPPNEITYRQINDIIGMFASDQVPTQTITPNNGQINANQYDTLQKLMSDSKSTVNVTMDYRGRISVTDKLSTGTNIGVSLSDSQSGQFPQPPYTHTANSQPGPDFSFNANNSLVIDEPNVDVIKDLDLMIEAVLSGNMRANADGDNPRNTGMQGALERLDHLSDHINKLNTTMGAYHNNIDNVNTRVTFLGVNVQTLKTKVNDADYAETLMNLMQTQLAYQASMKATTTISQLSLLNYM